MAKRKNTSGARPLFTNYDALRALVGMTEVEVKNRMGEPDTKSGANLTGEMAVWQYANAYQEPGFDNPKTLFVYFDDHGNVSHASWFSPEQVAQVAESERRAKPFVIPDYLANWTPTFAETHNLRIITPPVVAPEKPSWDGTTLWYQGKDQLNYRRKTARTAQPILDLLERAGWPDREVPVPPRLRSGLRTVILRINKKLADSSLRLQSGGDGKSVRWVRVPHA